MIEQGLFLKKIEKSYSNFNKAKSIFHLGACTNTLEDNWNYLKHNNLYYSKKLYEFSNYNSIKFIYASSASVYGLKSGYQKETDWNLKPLNLYAKSKYEFDKFLFKNKKNINAIGLRFFNVYGPRSRASGPYSAVISIFVKQKLANKPLTVVGDGAQSRSFIYVSAVVEAMIKAAKSKIFNEIFNVGSQRSIKINEIVRIFKGKKIYIPKRTGDPKHSSANIKKITRKLNWKPKVSIKEGINILLKAANKQ